MNAALLSAFDPLEWHCTGCGAESGRPCREKHFSGLIQLNCPERINTAQHYGMELWREAKQSKQAKPSFQPQPNGAA